MPAPDLSAFYGARKPNTPPLGGKVDAFLAALPDERREAAEAALRTDPVEITDTMIERVFQDWNRDVGWDSPPKARSIRNWRLAHDRT